MTAKEVVDAINFIKANTEKNKDEIVSMLKNSNLDENQQKLVLQYWREEPIALKEIPVEESIKKDAFIKSNIGKSDDEIIIALKDSDLDEKQQKSVLKFLECRKKFSPLGWSKIKFEWEEIKLPSDSWPHSNRALFVRKY